MRITTYYCHRIGVPICIFFILIGTWLFNNFAKKTNITNIMNTNQLKIKENILDDEVFKSIKKTRKKIRTELSNYNFNDSGVSKLEDLLMESGGNPIRSIVVSTWRSGSTFLGDIINSMPGNFYYYEPLLRYKIVQLRSPLHADKIIKDIKKMLQCNLKGLNDYFEYGKTDLKQFSYNTRLWEHCQYNKELCFDEKFTEKFCKQFPFISMKLVRARLHLFEEILKEKELNAKIVLLVRDPRGLMQSRHHKKFCFSSPDCWSVKVYCDDMVNDYLTAQRFRRHYPNQITVLRFEDLALNLDKETRQLFKFLRIGYTHNVDDFFQSHTLMDARNISATKRVTRDIPFKWKKILFYEFVDQIQLDCEEAMNLWGYKIAHNETHMRSDDFNPLKDYSII